MFVQATKSTRKGKTYISYLVRESYRTKDGPRSRTVCNISGLPEDVREVMTEALKGKTMIPVEEIGLRSALDYGGLAVVKQAWEDFGLGSLFEKIPSKRDRDLLQAMIFGRILFPSSKLALAKEAEGSLLAAACGLDQRKEKFDEDGLYEAMDQLNERWVGIEKELYQKAFPNSVSLVLYDLTSVYFEGKGPAGIAQYGYSRDHRPDRKQVLLAVATDGEGVPIHLEVLAGNRADTTTLQGMVNTLQRRFGIQEAIFVFDGGMSSKINLEQMEEKQLLYVTRLSGASLEKLVKQLPKDSQPQLWDRTKVMEVEHDGKRYVIAGGEERQFRDAERREARLRKAEAALENLASRRRKKPDAQKLASTAGRLLARLSAHKYFTYQVDEAGKLMWSRKAELIENEKTLDGLYLLHTNVILEKADGPQILRHYKNLIAVENAFCHLKSYLEVRPVFHYRPDRVRNHIRICFVAYWLTARLGQRWRALGETREVPALLRRLQSIRVGFLSVKDKPSKALMTQVPKEINDTLKNLNLLELFKSPPGWATL